ncbi:kinase-like domain-containing protein [Tricharina praecox]|uniref:kinase-like domain-containing protein n=1 Tax=Tricharina praecox TaxID=43433 RepID=UPI00221F932C|nr:kinase-like domain-containing protein [Tricharina praecox]KAI5856334.1 kinase-like domain-containing protein [Tricharina praecox]
MAPAETHDDWTFVNSIEPRLLRSQFQREAQEEIRTTNGTVAIYHPDKVRKFLSECKISSICETMGLSLCDDSTDSRAIRKSFLKTTPAKIHKRFCLILGILIETKWTDVLPCFVHDRLNDQALEGDSFQRERFRQFHERHGLPPDFSTDFWRAKKSFFLPKIRSGEHHVIRKDDLLPVSFLAKPLGRGSHGVVYAGNLIPGLHWSDETQTPVAAKKFNTSNDRNIEYDKIQKFAAHPFVLPALCTIDHGSSYYILFPRCKTSLRDLFKVNECTNSPAEMLQHYVGLLGALAFLHRDQREVWNYHFDIKTSNILVKYNGVFVLIDFGTAYSKTKLGSQDSGTEAGKHSYSAEYKAPESGKIGRKFDVWAIGCIGIELLVWIKEGARGVRSFQKSRQKDIPRSEMDRTPYYYVGNSLAPSVHKKLRILSADFPGEVDILRRMLKIDPSNRITAETAHKRFED